MTTVAFLGLGRMGAPMAANLARAGHDVVLHNRTHAKAEALAKDIGATAAPTARDAVASCEVVVTMLADEAAVLAVYEGEDGVLAGIDHGAVVIDMGTTGPAGVARLADRLQPLGVELVDAPVSGSTAAADSAALTIMAGGSEDAFSHVREILEAMGDTVYHLGTTGAGSVAKLAVNNIIYALGNAVSESLVMAERAGLDRAAIYEVFENSAVAAPMITYRHDAFLDPEHTPPAFALALALKDLRLITGLAESVDVPVEQAVANRSLVSKAVDDGFGDHDMADVAVYLRNRAATTSAATARGTSTSETT